MNRPDPNDPSSLSKGRRGRSGRRMGPDEDPLPVSEALGAVADRIGAGPPAIVLEVFSRWEQLVGPAVSTHVRPLRLDGETLIVAVDHPAWSLEVQRLGTDLLARIRDECGAQGAPRNIEVRVRR